MDEQLRKLCDWVDAHREEIVADVLESVKNYSPSEDREAVSRSLDWFAKKAAAFGYESQLRANGEVLSIWKGNQNKCVGLISHADVVPIGDAHQWSHNPCGERSDDRIYGRGVLDDKGMAVLCLWCMRGILENMDVTWKMETIIGSREEIEWTDIDQYKKEGWKLPDYSFTPDGNFPMFNREKGFCNVEFIFTRGGHDKLSLTSIKGAEASNSVPGFAEAEYNGQVMTAVGKAVHSSLPESGDNALVKLLAMLDEAGVSAKEFEGLYRFNREKLAKSHDGADSLFLQRHPRERNGEDMGYTTAVPTMAWLEGDKLHLNMNLRTVYGTTREELDAGFVKVCTEYGCRYIVTDTLEPLYVPASLLIVRAMGRAYELITGEKMEYDLACGTSYAKAFPNCVAFGPVFPGQEDMSHAADEYITEDNLFTAMKIYLLSLAFFLRGQKN